MASATDITSILRCPVTRAALELLGGEALDALKARIGRGEIVHPGGHRVEIDLDGALAASGSPLGYPIVDGIYVLVPSLALVPADRLASLDAFDLPCEMQSVMRFYDEVGWRQAEGGDFADAELFEDLRPISARYIHDCHLRVKRHLAPSGRFLLDVASGPIQYPEYLAYSQGYDLRICGDLSLRALREARKKLGSRGVYLQCDITRLPLADGSVDAFTSLHTIYHVPEDRQALAFRELERVLAPGRSGVVVYTWGGDPGPLLQIPARAKAQLRRVLPRPVVAALRSALGRAPAPGDQAKGPTEPSSAKPPSLYFHPHTRRWFQEQVAAGSSWEIFVWRSVSVPFLKRWVRGAPGRLLLRAIYHIEEASPTRLARYGQYPLMVFRKGPARHLDSAREGGSFP